jgi:hypothetical protein
MSCVASGGVAIATAVQVGLRHVVVADDARLGGLRVLYTLIVLAVRSVAHANETLVITVSGVLCAWLLANCGAWSGSCVGCENCDAFGDLALECHIVLSILLRSVPVPGRRRAAERAPSRRWSLLRQ